jgi:peptidoglycan hydrolase CwlO-like protein
MQIRFYHATLRNKKNHGFLDGELTVAIGPQGHFTVNTEVEAKAIEDNHGEVCFREGSEGFVEFARPEPNRESKLYAAELEIRIEELKTQLAQRDSRIAELEQSLADAKASGGSEELKEQVSKLQGKIGSLTAENNKLKEAAKK